MSTQILNELGFDQLLEAERVALLAYAANLLLRLDEGEFGDPPDDECIHALDGYYTDTIPNDDELSRIFNRIKLSKDIERCQTGAMLASIPDSPFIDYKHYERIKAWSLLAIIGLSLEGGHAPVIKEGARRVRRMLIPKDQWMLDEFPDFSEALKNTVFQLENLRTEHRQISLTKGNFVGHVQTLLKDYITHRLPKEYEISDKPAEGKHRRLRPIEIPPTSGLEEPDYEYSEIIDKPTRDIVTVTEKELESDRAIGSKYIQSENANQQFNNRSVAMRAIHAKTMANRLSMREMQLPSDWGTLTHYESTTLLRECWDGARRGKIDDLFISLMFLTGRNSRRLFHSFLSARNTDGDHVIIKGQHATFSYTPDLPTHYIPACASQLAPRSTHDTLYLTFPDEIFNSIKLHKSNRAIEYSDIQAKINERISDINRKYGGHISAARISGNLFTRVRAICHDPADAAFICGHSPQQCPALYYYAPNAAKLIEIYREASKEVFDSSGITLTYPDSHSQDFKIGTHLTIDEPMINALFIEQAKQIESLRKSPRCNPERFHNEYVAYTYQLLSLGTGHRPVTAPFEFRNDIDLNRKVIWISDKEVRSGLAARTLPLANQLCEQVAHYNQHLQELHIELSLTAPVLATKIQGALTSHKKYLPWIRRGHALSLKPKILESYMSNRWPLPLNWQRHYMRNALRSEGISGDEVNAWMGHAHFGEEALGPWSGLSMKSLQNTADAVERILTRLDIPVIPGWKQRP